MLSPNYTTVEIADDAKYLDIKACLLARLAHLVSAGNGAILGEKDFALIAGTDKWGKTVIKAFTIWADGGDYERFVDYHASEGPWEPPDKEVVK